MILGVYAILWAAQTALSYISHKTSLRGSGRRRNVAIVPAAECQL